MELRCLTRAAILTAAGDRNAGSAQCDAEVRGWSCPQQSDRYMLPRAPRDWLARAEVRRGWGPRDEKRRVEEGLKMRRRVSVTAADKSAFGTLCETFE